MVFAPSRAFIECLPGWAVCSGVVTTTGSAVRLVGCFSNAITVGIRSPGWETGRLAEPIPSVPDLRLLLDESSVNPPPIQVPHRSALRLPPRYANEFRLHLDA